MTDLNFDYPQCYGKLYDKTCVECQPDSCDFSEMCSKTMTETKTKTKAIKPNCNEAIIKHFRKGCMSRYIVEHLLIANKLSLKRLEQQVIDKFHPKTKRNVKTTMWWIKRKYGVDFKLSEDERITRVKNATSSK